MKLKPQELTSLGYCLDKELDHSELIPFVKANMKQTNPLSVFYWAFNLAAIALFIFFIIQETRLSIGEAFAKFLLGFFLFFLVLLPIHELIHGLFYKLSGAPDVKFAAQWRKLIFYCVADGFVADTKSFLLVALTPFLIINACLIIMMFYATPGLFYTFLGALILHTGGCFGDFGLASYLYNHKLSRPVTYDDAAGKKTYFFLNTHQH
jgi:hypothetical protein